MAKARKVGVEFTSGWKNIQHVHYSMIGTTPKPAFLAVTINIASLLPFGRSIKNGSFISLNLSIPSTYLNVLSFYYLKLLLQFGTYLKFHSSQATNRQ